MTSVMHELSGALILLGLFLAVIAMTEYATRKKWLPAEPARKSIHVAGGLGCLLFPFLVTSWVTVMGLAIVLAITLHYGERCGMLKSLGSVERKSYGALLFPLAILFLFIVSQGRIWLYVSSLLVLVLADTAAALAGTRFGRMCYDTVPGQKKSLEGTAMFAVVGFFSVYLSLLALADIPPMNGLFIALLIAALLAMLEAVSIGGTDNIFVPIGTCFLLLKMSEKPQMEIIFQCLSFILIATIVFLLNRQARTFRTRTLLIFILAVYATWALGSLDWLIPVGVGFFVYNWVCHSCAPLPADLTARRMLRPLYPLLIILFLANARLAFDFWFGPFMVATATTTSLCIGSRFRRDQNLASLKGARLWVTLFLPAVGSLLLSLPMHGGAVVAVLPFIVPICAVVPLIYFTCKHSISEGFPWNYAITIHAAAAALAYAGLERLHIVQPLQPLTWMEVFR